LPVTKAPPTIIAITPTPIDPQPGLTQSAEVTAAPVEPTSTPTQLPSSASLTSTFYERQGNNNCGPASLSIYLHYYGWKGDQKDIAAELKSKSEDRNINVEELVHYARNYAGWLNTEYRVGGDLNLIRAFLANGIPVMVESGIVQDETYWPNDDKWAGHYLFINGYNDATQTFVTQDTFFGPDKTVTYTNLESNWQEFNHVYIVIYPPDLEETVKELMGDNWDKDTNRENALEKAREMTELEPKNAYHWFNLGSNLVYFEDYGGAAEAYDEARNIGIPQRMLRYQFGPFLAYFNSLRTDDLITIAKYAVNITPTAEEAHLWLGWGYFRKGDRVAAEAEFRKALQQNVNYADAKYALNYLATTP